MTHLRPGKLPRHNTYLQWGLIDESGQAEREKGRGRNCDRLDEKTGFLQNYQLNSDVNGNLLECIKNRNLSGRLEDVPSKSN